MAWSTPLTAVANVALTAVQWNASVRDNLNETAPANATASGRIITTTGLNAVTERDIVTASVATVEATASTAYVSLTTVGPDVTVTTGTKALVMIGAVTWNATTGARQWMSHAISGASTAAASDTYAVVFTSSVTGEACAASHLTLWTTLTAGSNTFASKYRASTGTGSWQSRRLIVMAI